MVDGVPANTNGEIDPSDIERLEVIKGPSGTLYGGSVTSFGGLINAVTKTERLFRRRSFLSHGKLQPEPCYR